VTTGFTTERQDPDLERVSAALLRAGERTRQLARQTSTGISVQIDGELRLLQGAEMDGAMILRLSLCSVAMRAR
jgi:apolipoprotein N-acyltransferase